MKKETKVINILTDTKIKKIATDVVAEWFDKDECPKSLRTQIRNAIIVAINLALEVQDGAE